MPSARSAPAANLESPRADPICPGGARTFGAMVAFAFDEVPRSGSAYPASAAQPTVSDLNWTAGETVPNLVVVKTGTGGEVNLYNYAGSVDVIADEVGYYM